MLEARQITQIFVHHNGISRSLNRNAAAFSESTNCSLWKAADHFCGKYITSLAGPSVYLKKGRVRDLDPLPSYAQITLVYASVIPALKQGVILICLFQATNIDGNKKTPSGLHATNGKRKLLSSSGFMQAFYLPDTLQYIWDDWPCIKSFIFFLCFLHSSSPALPGCWISHLPSSH